MISKKTKYGLKALIYIANNGSEGKVQVPVIAKEESIPKKFLESILLDLKKAGFLGSQKGKGGGYYLREDPTNISIAQIYRVLEGPIAPLPCVSLNFYEKCDDCKDEETCNIHLLMIKVRDASLAIYTNNTLADLLN